MNKKNSLVGALLISASVVTGADTLYIRDLSLSALYDLKTPILLDSINVNKTKFEPKSLLSKTNLSTENLSWENVTSENGDFSLKTTFQPYSIGYARFYVETTDFAKATLIVEGSPMFELIVDGKSLAKKEDWKKSEKTAKLDIEPGKREVLVKYLVAKDKKESDISISLVSDSKTLEFSLDKKHPLTIEDLMTGRRMSGVSISANGDYLLASDYLVDKTGKTYFSYKLMKTDSGEVIYEWDKSMTFSWMPKSNALMYKRAGMNGSELVKFDPSSLETSVIARNIPDGTFKMSPNEEFLIYTIQDKFASKEKDVFEVIVPDDRIAGWKNRSNVYKYDLATGMLDPITYGFHNTYLNDISPNSDKIIIGQAKEDITKMPFDKTIFMEIDLASYEVDTLFENSEYINSVNYMTEADELLIKGSGNAFDNVGLNIGRKQTSNLFDGQLFIYDRSSKVADPITKDFAPSVSRAVWHRPTGEIYLSCVDKDYERLYTYQPQTKAFDVVKTDIDIVTSWDVADDDSRIAFLGNSVDYADRLEVMAQEDSKVICDAQEEKMTGYELGEVKDWSFKSNGTTIEGRYYLPPNFDPNKKYPMVVYYYSGTTPTSRNFFHPYSMHLYAAQGYVVYALQPSGTIGFGQEFSARHVNAWGKQTADDIIKGVTTFCKEHSFVDASKVGCMGASYGGFMTMYLQTRTDIFAAAVSHAGISALSSYWGEGYWGYSYSAIASANSYPWNNRDLYVDQSPLFSADKVQTPLLLLHGTADTNVPPGESIQMFAALKLLGKDVNFIQVKGENHGIAQFDKRLEWKKSIFAFFAKYLKDEDAWWNEMYPAFPQD